MSIQASCTVTASHALAAWQTAAEQKGMLDKPVIVQLDCMASMGLSIAYHAGPRVAM